MTGERLPTAGTRLAAPPTAGTRLAAPPPATSAADQHRLRAQGSWIRRSRRKKAAMACE